MEFDLIRFQTFPETGTFDAVLRVDHYPDVVFSFQSVLIDDEADSIEASVSIFREYYRGEEIETVQIGDEDESYQMMIDESEDILNEFLLDMLREVSFEAEENS